MRRYDIDAIRVSALCLLILYHATCAFQPWGHFFSFIGNSDTLESIWISMEMLNIWRLPILFTISGMGVCLALEHRGGTQFLLNRCARLFVPFVFGSYFITPISLMLFQSHYQKPVTYIPNPGHLWFLFNIFYYSLLSLPIFLYWKRHPDNVIFRMSSAIIQRRFGIIPLFALPILLEAWIINPESYASFALHPVHGPIVGFIFFISGFFYVSLRDDFGTAVKQAFFLTFALALSLYVIRIAFTDLYSSHLVFTLATAFEATNWILAAFGFATVFLNKPSGIFRYFSSAVYPVYIVHLPVQQFFVSLLASLAIPAVMKLAMVVTTTFGGCLLLFEIIKRIKYLRYCLGIKSPVKTHESSL